MSEPVGLPPSGAGSSAPVVGTRAQAAVLNELAGRLQAGMRVEIIPTRSIGPDLIEAQLRPLAGSATWTQGVRVQLTAALPTNALQAVTGGGSAPGTSPTLRAEVVATGPTLILKILAPAEGSPSTPGSNPAALAGSREWLGQQFRQHWPESRPLAVTLENITARLAKEIGTDAVAVPKTVTPLPAPNANETLSHLQIRQAVATLIDQLASAAELTDPERLSTAVSRSGLWMEALLAQAALDPAQSSELKLDLKAQLLTLAQQIRVQAARPPSVPPAAAQPTSGHRADAPTPQPPPASQAGARTEGSGASTGAEPRAGATPEASESRLSRVATTESGSSPKSGSEPPEETRAVEQNNQRTTSLARDVEGMLKQVVTKQLQSLDSPAGQTQWLLELPFRTPTGLQALEADIRREQARNEDEHETWSMRLRLDLPKLGPLHILLTLRNERLNASLQAGDPDGAEQIKRHLGDLRTRLEAREIEVASLHAGHRPLSQPAPPFDDPLVREQA